MKIRYVLSALFCLFVMNMGTFKASATVRTVTIQVKGMTCDACATTVEKALKETVGVLDAHVSYKKSEAWVKYDDEKVTPSKLREVINGTGFKAVEEKHVGVTDQTTPKANHIQRHAPEANQLMSRKYSKNIAQLPAKFNADKGKVRLLMLLSPS
jgi:copper chaperone CopZ